MFDFRRTVKIRSSCLEEVKFVNRKFFIIKEQLKKNVLLACRRIKRESEQKKEEFAC